MTSPVTSAIRRKFSTCESAFSPGGGVKTRAVLGFASQVKRPEGGEEVGEVLVEEGLGLASVVIVGTEPCIHISLSFSTFPSAWCRQPMHSTRATSSAMALHRRGAGR